MTQRSVWVVIFFSLVLNQAPTLQGRPAPTGAVNHWPLQQHHEPLQVCRIFLLSFNCAGFGLTTMHGEQDSSPDFWGSELQGLPFMSLLDGSADHLFLGLDHHQDHASRPQSFLQHQGEQDKNTQVPLKLEQSESRKDGS